MAVNVIFVPISLEQGSSSVLVEMVQLGLLLKLTDEGQNPLMLQSTGAFKSTFDDATKIVSSLPAIYGDGKINTGIVSYPLRLFDYFCTRSNARFFVNQSWTVAHEQYSAYIPTPMFGRLVTAAGNSPNTDVFSTPYVDFFARSASTFEIVGVLNVLRGKGLSPTSSKADPAIAIGGQVVGFDGTLNSSETGTSFSAPRVAWILAAAEASSQSTTVDAMQWSADFKRLSPSKSAWFERG